MRHASWVLVLSLSSTIACAAEKTIEPGYYEIVTKSAVGTTSARKCLTVADATSGFTPDLGKDCKPVRSVVSGGKLDFETACPDMAMTMSGTYTATSYVIDGKVMMKGDKDPLQSRVTAKRIAETCPAN